LTIARLTDVEFENDNAVNYNIQVGDDSDTPQLILNRVKLTGLIGSGLNANCITVFVKKGASLTATDTNFARSNSNHVKSLGPVTLTRVRMGPFGQGVAPAIYDPHYEAIQAFSGTVLTITDLICDMRGLTFRRQDGSVAAGASAYLFIDPGSFKNNPTYAANVTANLTRMILLGAFDTGTYYAVYGFDAAPYTGTINMTASVIGKGFNGKWGVHGSNCLLQRQP
jgi:hypothetical protein